MNIEIFIGSPRKNGNTAAIAKMFIRAAGESDCKCTEHFLYKTNFGPCVDCRRCLSGDFVCPVDDEMQYFYKRLDDADVVVVGTPIYWFGPSGPAKLFLDRLRPYYRSRRLEGKVLALLLPAADGDGDCDLTIEMFRRSASLLGMKFAGAVTAKAFDAGEVIGDSGVEQAAAELVDTIAAL